MGARGPQRKPGSVRWNREVKAKQQVKAGTLNQSKGETVQVEGLPTCPAWLPKLVADSWTGLVIDMAAAGVPLKQLDSRAITVAAGYEVDLTTLEEMCADPEMESDSRLSAMRLKNSTRKDYLSALIAIGGTPVARLRARIAPEEKQQKTDDPWGDL